MVFLRIVLPMSKALIATLIIFSTVDLWNQFREAIIYIRESKHYTLQVYVRIKVFLEEMIQRDPSLSSEMFGDVFGSETLKATILAVTSIPIALVYPFFQRYFIKGATLGAVQS